MNRSLGTGISANRPPAALQNSDPAPTKLMRAFVANMAKLFTVVGDKLNGVSARLEANARQAVGAASRRSTSSSCMRQPDNPLSLLNCPSRRIVHD